MSCKSKHVYKNVLIKKISFVPQKERQSNKQWVILR